MKLQILYSVPEYTPELKYEYFLTIVYILSSQARAVQLQITILKFQ